MTIYQIKRFLIYIVGLLILAFGVALSVRSKLGVAPVTSIPCILNLTTGLSIGTITFVLYILFVITQVIILKHEFRKKDFLQVLFSSVFGIFTDMFLYITLFIKIDNLLFKIILSLSSCIIIAFGVFLVVTTDIIMNAPDGLCNAIGKKYNMKFGDVKIRFDFTLVTIAIFISIISMGRIKQIGIGTIMAAMLIGKFVNVFAHKYEKKVKSCYLIQD